MKEHNLANSISSFQNGLNNLFSSTSFYCKRKFIEGIVMRREKYVFFLISDPFFKIQIFKVVIFFSHLFLPVTQSTKFFSGSTFIRFMFLMKYFSS